MINESHYDEAEMARARALLAADPTPVPTAFADPLDLDALIAQARVDLAVKPEKATDKTYEAPNPHLVNTLLARADDFKRLADAATKERDKITSFLADMIEAAETEPGAIEELTVNGATVFTYKPVTSRVLNQAHLKSLFPDVAGNEECWSTTTTRPRKYA